MPNISSVNKEKINNIDNMTDIINTYDFKNLYEVDCLGIFKDACESNYYPIIELIIKESTKSIKSSINYKIIMSASKSNPHAGEEYLNSLLQIEDMRNEIRLVVYFFAAGTASLYHSHRSMFENKLQYDHNMYKQFDVNIMIERLIKLGDIEHAKTLYCLASQLLIPGTVLIQRPELL